jgi:16S rRNA processing protein RimM
MLEPVEDQYKKIGYISRSHGVKGDVLIIPEVYTPALFDSLELVRLQNTRGDLIPARIESVRVQEKNNRLSFFVKFEHVTNRTRAEELKNASVFADRKMVDHLMDEEAPIDLTSFEIHNEHAVIGSVMDVIDNPAHPILQVFLEGHGQLLIPFVDEYIVGVDEDRQAIYCRNLNQLTEL